MLRCSCGTLDLALLIGYQLFQRFVSDHWFRRSGGRRFHYRAMLDSFRGSLVSFKPAQRCIDLLRIKKDNTPDFDVRDYPLRTPIAKPAVTYIWPRPFLPHAL